MLYAQIWLCGAAVDFALTTVSMRLGMDKHIAKHGGELRNLSPIVLILVFLLASLVAWPILLVDSIRDLYDYWKRLGKN